MPADEIKQVGFSSFGINKNAKIKKGIFRYYSVPVLNVAVVGQQLYLLVALCFSLLNKHILSMFWTIFLEVRLVTVNGPRNDVGTTSHKGSIVPA